jgi:hypothetical protein
MQMKGKSKASKTPQDKDCMMSNHTSTVAQNELPLFVTAELTPQNSEMISTDKSLICNPSIQKPKSSKTSPCGINFKRKGLQSLLDKLLRGDKFTLVVACRDRLARFGFELIQYMVEQNGGQIVVLDATVHCPNTELTQDLLSIIHVFSRRMHGLRKYSQKIKEDLSKSDTCTESDN